MPSEAHSAEPGHPSEITLLLRAAAGGDRAALDTLFDAVYGELKRLARSQRRQWDGNYTLNTTALVHEAYLKLARQDELDWRNRTHFYRVAGRAMRHILVNYAERSRAAKRGGGAEPVPIDETNPVAPEVAEEILAVNEALVRLAEVGARPVQVVECRFFAGLTVPETAEALGISPATVKRDWTVASAWLRRELGRREGGAAMG